MSITTLLAVYLVSWWLTLFAILPIGIRSQIESGDVVPGTEPGAPASPRIWRAVGLTTVAAIPVSVALYLFITTVN